MQAGANAAFPKPLPQLPRGRGRGWSRFIVAEAPATESPATLRWPGWSAMLLAIGGASLGWVALIGGALALVGHR